LLRVVASSYKTSFFFGFTFRGCNVASFMIHHGLSTRLYQPHAWIHTWRLLFAVLGAFGTSSLLESVSTLPQPNRFDGLLEGLRLVEGTHSRESSTVSLIRVPEGCVLELGSFAGLPEGLRLVKSSTVLVRRAQLTAKSECQRATYSHHVACRRGASFPFIQSLVNLYKYSVKSVTPQ
jgi:hypothetical protein